jgi:hypothetical protein
MPRTPRYLRGPLVALVAIFAASFSAGEVSACSTMKQGPEACKTACGCCSTGANAAPATRAEARPAALPEAPQANRPAPTDEGCSCRSQKPAAPTQKPARSTAESRPELGESLGFVTTGEGFAAQTLLAPQVPATQSPPKAPLYLQNVRLLF